MSFMIDPKKISLVLMVLFLIFLSGCSIGKTASYVVDFQALSNESRIEVNFSVMDQNKEYIATDGTAEIRIQNSAREILYTATHEIKEKDFQTYTNKITNKEFLACSWEIPLSEIKKSTKNEGTIFLKFRTKNAEFEELKTSIFGLPIFSEDELSRINDREFLKNAINVNKTQQRGNFLVAVVRAGKFIQRTQYEGKKEFFRIDFKFKNTGSKKEDFMPSGMAILDENGNQFETDFGGTIDSFSEIYPGIEKPCYQIFKKIPSDVKKIKLVFELGYDENFEPYKFEYSISLKHG